VGYSQLKVTGPNGTPFNVDENGQYDSDSTVGKVVIKNLVPGNYKVCQITSPTGYGVVGLSCRGTTLYAGTTTGLWFTQGPIVTLKWSVKDSLIASALVGGAVFLHLALFCLRLAAGLLRTVGSHDVGSLTRGASCSGFARSIALSCPAVSSNEPDRSLGNCSLRRLSNMLSRGIALRADALVRLRWRPDNASQLQPLLRDRRDRRSRPARVLPMISLTERSQRRMTYTTFEICLTNGRSVTVEYPPMAYKPSPTAATAAPYSMTGGSRSRVHASRVASYA